MQTPEEILKTLHPKYNKTKIFLFVIGVLFVFVAGVALVMLWSNKSPNYTYTTKPATLGSLQTTISANGTLSPTHVVSIGSVISGIVLEVLVDVNDTVSKGQVLAKIDSESIEQNLLRLKAQLTSAKAQLKSAQVNLEEKKWQYQQLQALHTKTQGKIPSQLELQSAKTAHNAALSEVEIRQASIAEIKTSIRSTQVDLKNAHIITPIDGIVLSRSIEVGQSVAASFQAPEFFIIAESLEEMELNVSISEADIGKVKAGQHATFYVDSYPNKTFNGKVNRVNFGSEQNANNIVSYQARINVDNKDLLLRPGMSATADITTQSVENTLLVPASALYFSPRIQSVKKPSLNLFGTGRPVRSNTPPRRANSSVWILQDNLPKEIPVKVGISDGVLTQIFSDAITQGTEIILSQKAE